jgi:Zn-dependent protease
MMGSFHMGRILGIPLKIHITLIIFLPLFAGQFARLMGLDSFFFGTLAAVGLFVSVALHELGHSVVAMSKGIRVREILLLPIGGIAQLERMTSRPRDELHIAIAGPLTSLAVALVFYAAAHLIALMGLASLALVLATLAAVNLVLAVFNMLPAFPMDGGRVLRAAMTPRIGRMEATRLASGIGRFLAVLLGIWGLYIFNLLTVAIAIFVYFAAGAEYRMLLMQDAMKRSFGGMFGGEPPPPPPPWGAAAPPPTQEKDDDTVIVSPPPYARSSRRSKNIFQTVQDAIEDWMRR